MKVGILGTGTVGRTIAVKLRDVGRDVMIGTRDVQATMAKTETGRYGAPPFAEWLNARPGIELHAYSDAVDRADIVINATNGAGTLEAIHAAGQGNLDGKILIDLSNPLDFSRGGPPSLFVSNTDSLAEQIQQAVPQARVVKTLNIVNCAVMVDPMAVAGGDHSMLICGNDQSARVEVATLLREWFGWNDTIDLGDLTAARGMEMMLPAWMRLAGAMGSWAFGWKVAR